MGISGDESTHLLWRMRNGEVPSSPKPITWWVLIGTNDFGVSKCSENMVLQGIVKVVEELKRQRPHDKIVLNSLLPRSTNKTGSLEPPRDSLSKPFYWNHIRQINKQLYQYCEKDSSLYFFNATDIFVSKQNHELSIPLKLMPDRLHPSSVGYKKWGTEIGKFLENDLNVP